MGEVFAVYLTVGDPLGVGLKYSGRNGRTVDDYSVAPDFVGKGGGLSGIVFTAFDGGNNALLRVVIGTHHNSAAAFLAGIPMGVVSGDTANEVAFGGHEVDYPFGKSAGVNGLVGNSVVDLNSCHVFEGEQHLHTVDGPCGMSINCGAAGSIDGIDDILRRIFRGTVAGELRHRFKAYSYNMAYAGECVASLNVIFTAGKKSYAVVFIFVGYFPMLGESNKIVSVVFIKFFGSFGGEFSVAVGCVDVGVAFKPFFAVFVSYHLCQGLLNVWCENNYTS